MSILESVILGIIQGLTEFLPVSSSGHLVLFQNFFTYNTSNLLFDIWVHVATLLVVFYHYRNDVINIINEIIAHGKQGFSRKSLETPNFDSAHLGYMVVIASLPTAIIGFYFKSFLESLFTNIHAVGVCFLITAVVLLSTRILKVADSNRINWKFALAIGTIQAAAIAPGISRSGSTIALALLLGISWSHAARFSFLCSIPAIAGALLLQIIKVDAHQLMNFLSLPFIIGFISAIISGYIALQLLISFLKRGHLHWFSPYLVLLSLLTFML